MPSVLVQIPFGTLAKNFGFKPEDFADTYREVRKELLHETRKEFDNYRVRAGVTNKSVIKGIYLLDKQWCLYVMIPEDLPSSNFKKILVFDKRGNLTSYNLPLTSDQVWIFDGIVRKTFLTKIEEKYTSRFWELLVARALRESL